MSVHLIDKDTVLVHPLTRRNATRVYSLKNQKKITQSDYLQRRTTFGEVHCALLLMLVSDWLIGTQLIFDSFFKLLSEQLTARLSFTLITSHRQRWDFVCVQDAGENTATRIHCTHAHSCGERATQCLLPGSVLVDHVAVLLFRRHPNRGGFASARALATEAGWG